MNKRSLIFQCILFLLPWKLRKFFLKKMGVRLGKHAKIGYSLVMCENTELGDYSSIGHLNCIRGLAQLKLGTSSIIGNLNWITGLLNSNGRFENQHRKSSLILGAHSAITHRHYIDCTNEIVIGTFSTFAGIRSQILTHSVNIYKNAQESKPVSIGNYVFVGTGSIVLPGSTIADYCVVSAGSVVKGSNKEDYVLLSGNPAIKVKDLPENAEYFLRKQGAVN